MLLNLRFSADSIPSALTISSNTYRRGNLEDRGTTLTGRAARRLELRHVVIQNAQVVFPE